jgi:crotonobetainyl-CoA:carnitine CoA-transferase CaiB-like acyl-CoA transferase
MTAEALHPWASCGLLGLTGPANGAPLVPPPALVERLAELGRRLAALGVNVDPATELASRAAASGRSRVGRVSLGGSCRLMRCADGEVAVSLPRPADWEALTALLGRPERIAEGDWAALAEDLARRAAGDVVEQARLLALPISAVGECAGALDPTIMTVVARTEPRALAGAAVVDLSSLWAGPLCAALLQRAGAAVTKVESVSRPDGARLGDPMLFDRWNGGKTQRSVDISTEAGREELRRLVSVADVVITSSRPRALTQLGLEPVEMVERGPQIWVAITAHGQAEGDRVGFGDDSAAAGGLVAGAPAAFVADAVADPLSALVATVAVLDAFAAGVRGVADVALCRVAAWFASGCEPEDWVQ